MKHKAGSPLHAARPWTGFAAAATLSAGLAAQPSPWVDGNPLAQPIVFVSQVVSDAGEMQINDVHGNFLGDNPARDQPIGGNLYRLDPGQSVPVNLTQRTDAAVRNPEISWDGQRVLFSMKIGADGLWQLYEMGVDGTNLTQLTDTPHNETEPLYLPDGRIVFASDRLRMLDAYENFPTGQLHVMDPDGSNVVRLSEDPGGETHPTVTESGTIAFTRWQATIKDPCRAQADPIEFNELDLSRFSMWEMRPDGDSNGHSIYGMHIIDDFRGGFVHSRPLYDGTGRFVAVIATSESYSAGGLAIIDPADEIASNGNPTPVWITDPTDYDTGAQPASGGRYRDPYPVGEDSYLTSFAEGMVTNMSFIPELNQSDPNFGLYLLEDNVRVLVYDDPDRWELEPVLVEARQAPPVLPPTLPLGETTGIFNVMDITLRAQMPEETFNPPIQAEVSTDDAAFIYLFQGVPSQLVYPGFPGYRQVQPAFLGRAPVHSDGSVAARIPANVPILWKAVDAQGEVLVEERFWNSLRPGQVQTCAGCHSPKDGSVGQTTNFALSQPAELSLFDPTRMIPGFPDAVASRLEWTTDQPRELDENGVPLPELFGVDGEELSDHDAIEGSVSFRLGVSINVDDPRLFGPFASTNTEVEFLELISPSVLQARTAEELAEANTFADALAAMGPSVIEDGVLLRSGASTAEQVTSAMVEFSVPTGTVRELELIAIDEAGVETIAFLELVAEEPYPAPLVGHEREDPGYSEFAAYTVQGGCDPPDGDLPELPLAPETLTSSLGGPSSIELATAATGPGSSFLGVEAWTMGARLLAEVESQASYAPGMLWASGAVNQPWSLAGLELWVDPLSILHVRDFQTDDQGLWRGSWVLPYEVSLGAPLAWLALIQDGTDLEITNAARIEMAP